MNDWAGLMGDSVREDIPLVTPVQSMAEAARIDARRDSRNGGSTTAVQAFRVHPREAGPSGRNLEQHAVWLPK